MKRSFCDIYESPASFLAKKEKRNDFIRKINLSFTISHDFHLQHSILYDYKALHIEN